MDKDKLIKVAGGFAAWETINSSDPNNKFVAEFESMKIAMEKTGVHTVTISQVCRGIRKSAGGYIWRYAEKCI